MSVYSATLKINVVTDTKEDNYGKVKEPSKFHELLDIEIKAPTLEKLQEKIAAHTALVEDM